MPDKKLDPERLEASSVRNSSFRREPQQRRSQEKVEKILQAAAAVFWEVGFEAATTHAIAQKANTAVGTLYRFFPNKLAIFHALEKQHRQSVDDIHAQLMSPEFVQQPIADMVAQTIRIYADYFDNLGPRVVYTQYYANPNLYAQFDEAVDYGYIRRFAIMLRMRNASLSVAKSELVAEVCHRSFNTLFLQALKSEPAYRDQLYQELQKLLLNYLKTYDTGCHELAAEVALDVSRLNGRQKRAIAHIQQHGHITIQAFESLCPKPSRRTLQRDLKQLVTDGILQTKGDTNQLTYHLAD